MKRSNFRDIGKNIWRYISPILYKISPELASKTLYTLSTRKRMNLKNPKIFNEKIMWLKLNYKYPLVAKCADKYELRDYVKEKGYENILINLYGVYESVDEIEWDKLPKKFALKCTHGCGYNIICDDKEKLDIEDAKNKLRKWMKSRYIYEAAEIQYDKMKPRIICEEYIETDAGLMPNDYKVFCFHGEPKFTLVCSDRAGNLKLNFMDLDWTPSSVGVREWGNKELPEKPFNYKEMLEIAKVLSKPFPFVRVDFYDYNGKIILGEMTFTPSACAARYFTETGAKSLGDLIKLPESILMIGPNPKKTLGGMSTVLRNYYKSDKLFENNIIQINTTSDGNNVKKIIEFIISYCNVFYKLLFKKIEILHIHSASRGSFYRKAYFVRLGKLFNKKVIFHLHGAGFAKFYEDECNFKKQMYIKNIFEICDKVVVLGKEWKDWLSKYVSSDIEVLHNAVEVPPNNNYSNISRNITMLGRLEERKGTYDLIEVIKDVVKVYPDVKFVLAGDGNLDALNKRIKELKIKRENLSVLGWIDEKKRHKILLDSLIYVLPSYNEGMPMSVLEAMSYGIPCISTNVGSIPSVIENNVNGLIVNPGDKVKLKESILNLLEDDSLRRRYSALSYKKVKSDFCIEKHIENLFKIYRK